MARICARIGSIFAKGTAARNDGANQSVEGFGAVQKRTSACSGVWTFASSGVGALEPIVATVELEVHTVVIAGGGGVLLLHDTSTMEVEAATRNRIA